MTEYLICLINLYRHLNLVWKKKFILTFSLWCARLRRLSHTSISSKHLSLRGRDTPLLLAKELLFHRFSTQAKTGLFVNDTHIDMECRLGVKVAALPGESVLLVNVVTNILQYLAQVLTTRHRWRTFFWTLSCATHAKTKIN